MSLPSDSIIHYLYVKQSFRRLGIGEILLEYMRGEGKTYCSHLPASNDLIVKMKDKGICYEPETVSGINPGA